jgi:hypothetical protein
MTGRHARKTKILVNRILGLEKEDSTGYVVLLNG